MKIPQQQVEQMRKMIAPLDTEENRAVIKGMRANQSKSAIPNHPVRDWNRVYRWQVFYAAKPYECLDLAREKVGDISDAHIYTVLKQIIPDL